jgi:hypothetical protein
LGIGGLGIGDWGLGIGPNPQSPIPNPQSPIPNPQSPNPQYQNIILIKNNYDAYFKFILLLIIKKIKNGIN